MSKIFSRKPLKEERRRLRSNMTSSEARLWSLLKSRQLKGRKFRRQHSIGSFIVDFYCPEEKLVVELDGHYHFTPSALIQDQKRDKYLGELGLTVLRFENKDLLQSMEPVLEEITSHFKQ